jgi:sortase (surface protein transpeptidase)
MMKFGWAKSEWTTFVVAALISLAVAGGIFAVVRHSDNGRAGNTASSSAGSGQASGASGSTRLASWSTMWNSGKLIIPSIGTDAPVYPEGATGPGGGALTIPEDIHDVGWWDGVWQSSGTGSSNTVVHEKVAQPGQSGVALIAGHIDSAVQGDGALYRLQQIKPGASITVIGQGNSVTKWTVTRLQIVLKTNLPRDLYVDTGPAQLAVVSCGGPFDAATGHYLDNVIAWAVPAK